MNRMNVLNALWLALKILAAIVMLIVTVLIFGFFLVVGFWSAYLGAG